MAKTRKKRKDKKPETESYEIKVEDWEVYYHFGINKSHKDIFPGDYREYCDLIFSGKIISPDLNIASKAKIWVMEKPELDNHWKEVETETPPLSIGWMEVQRGDDVLQINCWIPSRAFNFIPISAASEKIQYASIFGTKLKWRRGTILDLSLSTNREEE